jgi:hypothetical protein
VAEAVRRKREATLTPKAGWWFTIEKCFSELEPPPRPLQLRKLRAIFLDIASTPPVQEGRSMASDFANEVLTQDTSKLTAEMKKAPGI